MPERANIVQQSKKHFIKPVVCKTLRNHEENTSTGSSKYVRNRQSWTKLEDAMLEIAKKVPQRIR